MKRRRLGVLLISAMLAIQPVQMIWAGSAVDHQTGTILPGTGTETPDNNADIPQRYEPGWVAVEKGYQWRLEDGSFLQESGWVTIQGK